MRLLVSCLVSFCYLLIICLLHVKNFACSLWNSVVFFYVEFTDIFCKFLEQLLKYLYLHGKNFSRFDRSSTLVLLICYVAVLYFFIRFTMVFFLNLWDYNWSFVKWYVIQGIRSFIMIRVSLDPCVQFSSNLFSSNFFSSNPFHPILLG